MRGHTQTERIWGAGIVLNHRTLFYGGISYEKESIGGIA